MAELKPCPFCGGVAAFVVKSNRSDNRSVGFDFTIECKNCRTTTPRAHNGVIFSLSEDGLIVPVDDGRGKAIEAWNRRATE
jgi:Lar family restriction alleviation protein